MQWLRGDLPHWRRWAVTGVGLAASLLAIFEFVLPSLEAPAPMRGAFNIAVARFHATTLNGEHVFSREADALGDSFADALNAEVQMLDDRIEVRAPSQIGPVAGRTPEERERHAKQLAASHNADLMIYGTLEASNTKLRPQFYVSERRLTDFGAQDLAGRHTLGSELTSPVDIDLSAAEARAMREDLADRASAMAELVVALSYLVADQPAEAAHRLRLAAAKTGWPDEAGKEVVYLFLGTAYGRQGQLDEARRQFERAAELNPEYARARIGLAEVTLQTALGGCTPESTDSHGLLDAAKGYIAALESADRPVTADVPTKVHLGLGRVYACAHSARVADLEDEARDELNAVIAEYDAGNTRVREFAAEAHAQLGILWRDDDGNQQEVMAIAAEEFAAAMALSTSRLRRAQFAEQLAYACSRVVAPTKLDACTNVQPGSLDE